MNIELKPKPKKSPSPGYIMSGSLLIDMENPPRIGKLTRIHNDPAWILEEFWGYLIFGILYFGIVFLIFRFIIF